MEPQEEPDIPPPFQKCTQCKKDVRKRLAWLMQGHRTRYGRQYWCKNRHACINCCSSSSLKDPCINRHENDPSDDAMHAYVLSHLEDTPCNCYDCRGEPVSPFCSHTRDRRVEQILRFTPDHIKRFRESFYTGKTCKKPCGQCCCFASTGMLCANKHINEPDESDLVTYLNTHVPDFRVDGCGNWTPVGLQELENILLPVCMS